MTERSLTQATSERDPQQWAMRYMAHALLGLLAWHALLWTAHPVIAAALVPAVYLVGWEVLVQRVGAGWWDAAADTIAMGFGAALGLEILYMLQNDNLLAYLVVNAVGLGALVYGIWKRL